MNIDFEATESAWPMDISSALHTRLSSAEPLVPLVEAILARRSGSSCLAYGQQELSLSPHLREIIGLYGVLSDRKQQDSRKRAEAAVLMMAQRNYTSDFLNLLPLSIAMPLREAARTCQLGPPADWPVNAYEFVGRNDLTEGAIIVGDPIFNDGYRSMRDHLVGSR